MKTLDIDLNMKWNDYPSDTLCLWDEHTVFMISEGDGSNLLEEDEEAGYKDYWMTEFLDIDNDYENGGQWMETELIRDIDYTIQGVLDRLMECDLWESNWVFIDEDDGYAILNDEYENRLGGD